MLQIYHDNGFKLIHCNPDKTPKKKWREPKNHLSLKIATELQKTGEMIGAWIPPDIIVIDLDRHEGKPDGVETYKEIKAKYNIDINIISETFCVKTGGGGFHIFMYVGKDHGFTQGEKAPGIDLKTNAGYVIAAGSPGYTVHASLEDLDIEEIPESVKLWLESVNKKKPKKIKTEHVDSKNIPIDLLDKILKKLDVKKFDSNEKWFDFIVSAIAATGATQDVFDLLVDWSESDSNYTDTRARVESFDGKGEITTGTFIHILKEYGITQYFIKKVLSFNTSIELYETMRDDGHNLPFPEPDYETISESKEARELFITGGNTSGATLLGFAINDYILWSEGNKNFYIYDGNKWSEFNDMFSVAYTVLIRLTKFMYAKKKGSDVDNENFIKLVKTINKTHWKKDTIAELKCRDGIFYKEILWDSEGLKETVTTLDGVIDFTNNHVIVRKGDREEFRKSFIDFKSKDIIESKEPIKYNEFMSGLFHDKDTLFTARQASSMYISGNAKKVFQIYHGGGDNGKSTWLEIEAEILGDKSMTYPTEMIINNRFKDDKMGPEAAQFIGKYLLYGSEVDKGKQLSLRKIKNLTGDDTLQAKALYENPIEFRPTWQMILSVNDLPFFDGTDRAFINRLIIIPFEQTFINTKEEKEKLIERGFKPETISFKIDANVLKKGIRKEFPAIINQKINDYVDLKNNYNGTIKQSDQCIKHKETYISENNDFENFIEEMCLVSIDGNLFESTEDLTESYREYTGVKKVSSKLVSMSLKKLRQILTYETRIIKGYEKDPATGIQVEKRLRKRGLKNIRLKNIAEIEEENNKKLEENNFNKKNEDEIPF